MPRFVPPRPSGLDSEALSVADAAKVLGVSGRTVKRMIEDGELSAFRTPGGHLRIPAEGVKAIRGETAPAAFTPASSSSVLQNRRERVEELNLEAQEFRAQRQLNALRREEEEEEAEKRAEAAALRQERQDLASATLIEQQRIAKQEREEQERRQAEQEEQSQRQRFVSGWLEVGLKKEIPPGVPPDLRLQITEHLTAFLQDCRLQQRELILQMVRATVSNVLVPWRREQDIAAIIEEAHKMLPCTGRGFSWSPTGWDLKAKQAAMSAIAGLGESASLSQIRTAAILAVKPVLAEYEAEQRAEKLAHEKAQYLDHWFLRLELSSYVRQLLRDEAIELERGETVGDVASGLETGVRKHLDQHLTGTETRTEVLVLLRGFVRGEFKL